MPVAALLIGPAGAEETEPDFGGRLAPIYTVIDHPVPAAAQKLPLADIQRTIEIAGSFRHWQFEPLAPGDLHASYSNGKHGATVDVSFSQRAYSIRLVHTENLLQDGNTIHRTYNRWVRNLEKDIDVQLTRAGQEAR